MFTKSDLDFVETVNERVSVGYVKEIDQHYLVIAFHDKVPNKLFLPKLVYIKFLIDDFNLRVVLNDSLLKMEFKNFLNTFLNDLSGTDQTSHLVGKFNQQLKKLIEIGRKERKMSSIHARGLYGEMLYLKDCILKKRYPVNKILEGWQRPSPSKHDFIFDDLSVEVKTITRNNSKVKISSEHQLESLNEKPLILAIYTFDYDGKDSKDSVGDLFTELYQMLEKYDLENLFESKCFENNSYLGPKNEKLNYSFNLIESKQYLVDQNDFPRIKRDNNIRFISNVNYEIDISAITNFRI